MKPVSAEPESASSRDMAGSLPRKDTKREREQAIIADADKTETKDWDKVHGDGDRLDLDKPERNARQG